jgi:mono/diheme cytochrome c family protein
MRVDFGSIATIVGRTLAFAFLAALGSIDGARAGDGVERGKALAVDNCALCHVIGDHNPSGGINSTPSFWIFARKPEIYTERLRTFDQRRPHVSLDFDVSQADIENILAYVSTLRSQ